MNGVAKGRVALGALVVALVAWLVIGGAARHATSIDEVGIAVAEQPSIEHPFGTDVVGRDMVTRTARATRATLGIALFATLAALLVGGPIGVVLGSTTRRTARALERVLDVIGRTPPLVLAAVLAALAAGLQARFVPPASLWRDERLALGAALGGVHALAVARLLASSVRGLWRRGSIDALRGLGLRGPRIFVHAVGPEALRAALAAALVVAPRVLLDESLLSFLGLSARGAGASLGALLADGADAVLLHPWLLLVPTAVLVSCLAWMSSVARRLEERLGETASISDTIDA